MFIQMFHPKYLHSKMFDFELMIDDIEKDFTDYNI